MDFMTSLRGHAPITHDEGMWSRFAPRPSGALRNDGSRYIYKKHVAARIAIYQGIRGKLPVSKVYWTRDDIRLAAIATLREIAKGLRARADELEQRQAGASRTERSGKGQ